MCGYVIGFRVFYRFPHRSSDQDSEPVHVVAKRTAYEVHGGLQAKRVSLEKTDTNYSAARGK